MHNGKLRVMVVEDEVIIRYSIIMQLEKCGAEVIAVAGSGAEAVDIGINNPYVEFICMDINLGTGIDGVHAARCINSRRPLPVLFITAYNKNDFSREGIIVAGYVHKPVRFEDLDAALASYRNPGGSLYN